MRRARLIDFNSKIAIGKFFRPTRRPVFQFFERRAEISRPTQGRAAAELHRSGDAAFE